MAHIRQSSNDGAHETVRAGLWPWLSGKSPENIFCCPLFARKRPAVQGYLTHKKMLSSLGPPSGPRHDPVSQERGTPVARTWPTPNSRVANLMRLNLSHRMCLSISFSKKTPLRNRQLDILKNKNRHYTMLTIL